MQRPRTFNKDIEIVQVPKRCQRIPQNISLKTSPCSLNRNMCMSKQITQIRLLLMSMETGVDVVFVCSCEFD